MKGLGMGGGSPMGNPQPLQNTPTGAPTAAQRPMPLPATGAKFYGSSAPAGGHVPARSANQMAFLAQLIQQKLPRPDSPQHYPQHYPQGGALAQLFPTPPRPDSPQHYPQGGALAQLFQAMMGGRR